MSRVWTVVCVSLGVLCGARGWAAAPSCRYTINADTVLDNETGLLWQRAAATTNDWAGAISYCQNLNLGGASTGWRLPEIAELRSLVDVRATAPSIDSLAFPGTSYTGSGFWSATTFAGDAATAWSLYFLHGDEVAQSKTSWSPVRCVRSPSVSVSPVSQSVHEARVARVTVFLSARRGVDVTVPYTLSGTATSGADFSVSPASPVVIPAGQAAATITFSLNYDETTESSETVIVTLGAPGNAMLGTPDVHTLTILDGCTPDREWAEYVLPPDAPPEQNYRWNSEIVYDTVTGLTWQRGVPSLTYTYADATTYCQNLNLGGYSSGWRLPTRIELRSIVDHSREAPAINPTVFPNVPTGSLDYFWTSSVCLAGTCLQWAITFYNGSTYFKGTCPIAGVDSVRVKCVHD